MFYKSFSFILLFLASTHPTIAMNYIKKFNKNSTLTNKFLQMAAYDSKFQIKQKFLASGFTKMYFSNETLGKIKNFFLPTSKNKELFAAIQKHNLPTINTLISFHPNIVHARNNLSKTALHEAIDTENLETLHLLLMHGAEINAATTDGLTPLHYACIKNSSKDKESIVQLLLHFGANTNTKEKLLGHTPLHGVASHCIDKKIGQLLLTHNARLDKRNKLKRTPLHYAAYVLNKPYIELFIESHADINSQDCNNETPLHLATRPVLKDKNDKEVIEFLLAHGAKPDIHGIYGTPYEIALKTKRNDLIKLFQQYL